MIAFKNSNKDYEILIGTWSGKKYHVTKTIPCPKAKMCLGIRQFCNGYLHNVVIKNKFGDISNYTHHCLDSWDLRLPNEEGE